MKYILFFTVVGLFFWVALVPPEGMSKYPSVDLEFRYAQNGQITQVKFDAGLQPAQTAEEATEEAAAD